MYPRLPIIDPPEPLESLQGFGLRILGFVVRHGCTATLSLDDLKLADHTYPLAVSRRELDPHVVDTLSDARRLILDAIKWRELAIEETANPNPDTGTTPPVLAPRPTSDGRGDGGAHDRLIPKPKPVAPAGVANIEF